MTVRAGGEACSEQVARFANRATSPSSLHVTSTAADRSHVADLRRAIPGASGSGRRRELSLGFEPVLPVGADGLAPRQPAVIGVDRDLLAGGTPIRSRGAGGRRDAPFLDPL